MLYLYDNAIVADLRNSFNDEYSRIFVKAVDPEAGISIAAQLQNDNISFPLICVVRSNEYSVDTELTNFSMMHRGVPSVFDKKNNIIYQEQSIPIKLSYTLTVICTNTADADELSRELIYKYNDMYYVSIELPYEDKRKIRFGLQLDTSSTIDRESGFVDYLSDGKLYEVRIPLTCIGARLFSYKPVKLRNFQYHVEPYTSAQINKILH